MPGQSFIMECIGNCVWFFRLCRGGFGCSHGGGGGGGGCALCSLVLVCSSVTNTNIILHYSSFLVKKTL